MAEDPRPDRDSAPEFAAPCPLAAARVSAGWGRGSDRGDLGLASTRSRSHSDLLTGVKARLRQGKVQGLTATEWSSRTQVCPFPVPSPTPLPLLNSGTGPKAFGEGSLGHDDPQIPFVLRGQTFRRGNLSCWVPST